MENKNQIGSKTNNPIVVSAVAYLTLVGWFISAFLLNTPRQALCTFHIRQALGVNLLLTASGIVFVVPVLGWIAGIVGYLLGIMLWIMGLIYALQGEQKLVPVLGEKFQEWFRAL